MHNRWIGAGLLAGGAALLLLGGAQAEAATPIPVIGGTTTRYDAVYRRQCPRIPVEYLRALAYRESRSNPREADGGAWGLLQVVESVRASYNERFGTSYTRDQLLDPEVNARIACELIQRIVGTWNGPKYAAAFPGGFSWSSLRHVQLLTFAWNAGWSESRGVSGVILHLVRAGVSADGINIDAVRQTASSLTWPSSFVSRSDKVAWCKTVAAVYFQELRSTSA